MKILHILNELRPSGAETMLRSAAPYWRKEFQMEVLSTGVEIGTFAPCLSNAGYKVHHIPFKKNSLSFAWDIYNLMKKGDYDIVHIHTERCNFTYGLLAKLLRVPRIIRTVHSTFPFVGIHQCKRYIERLLLRKMGVEHIAIGPSVKEIEYKYFRNSTTIISNWYDDNHFRPPNPSEYLMARNNYGISPNTFVLSTIGNCSDIKNHTLLLHALRKLNNKFNYIYLHAGGESKTCNEQEIAHGLGISDRISFLGYQDDVLPILWASDIFVMPSINEGFSIAAVEALSTGIPAIFTDVPGLSDFKNFAQNCVWVKGSAEELALAIEKKFLSRSENKHHDRIQNAKAIKSLLGAEKGATSYSEIYKKGK